MKAKRWLAILPMMALVACADSGEAPIQPESTIAIEASSSTTKPEVIIEIINDVKIDFDSLGIKDYTYPTEFVLGQNLSGAITELVLTFEEYNIDETEADYYMESFLFHFCQNTRFTFDYLEKVREENNAIMTKEQVEYVQYSLTNKFIDMQKDISEEGININEAAGSLGYGRILSYQAEVVGNEVNLVAEFERGTNEFEPTKLYELNVVLVKNPKSCFDGYSIKSIASKNIQ
ncbi:MAG: hypothetical protein IJW18_03600 [Lachnospiraceae bacterium]|nr:hypothetical protein [Lachnospiraceae bacterium]